MCIVHQYSVNNVHQFNYVTSIVETGFLYELAISILLMTNLKLAVGSQILGILWLQLFTNQELF